MRAIEGVFNRLRARGEGVLIAYVMAGDPSPNSTCEVVGALVEGGADIVELGIPFSDPIADGPVIQAASFRSLSAGTTPRMVLELVPKIKERWDVPIVLLTYYNPIFRMGLESFFILAEGCGVDGVIVPDLPIEEAHDYRDVAKGHGIDTIFLAAPSTSTERLLRILDYTSGFLYLVSLFGVTGVRERVLDLTVEMIEKFLPYTRERIPLAVGFGISKPEHIKTIIKSGADGVIVGSALVEIIGKNLEKRGKMVREVEETTRRLKIATRVESKPA